MTPALRALALVGLLAAPLASAQAPDSARADGVAALALRRADGVVLRWAPTSPRAWDHGRRVGYVVERVAVVDGAPDGAGWIRLTPAPVRPRPLEWFGPHADRPDVAIAAEALYGESVVPVASSGAADLRNRATDLESRFGFSVLAADLDSVAAEGLGLRLVDDRLAAGAAALYRVTFAEPLPGAVDVGYAAADARPARAPAPPPGLVAEAIDGAVRLRWLALPPGEAFSGVEVERSDDGGRTFRPLLDRPLVSVRTDAPDDGPSFVDSTAAGRPAVYRVYGRTPFGTRSAPAEARAEARDLTPPAAPVVEGEATGGPRVRLRWTHPGDDVAAFRVGVADRFEGPFAFDDRTLGAAAREADDDRAVPGLPNYYLVVAVDAAGNATPSAPLFVAVPDDGPPAPPTGLRAAVDTLGHVSLVWAPGAEPDLRGWRVFAANDPTHAFTLATDAVLDGPAFGETVPLATLSRAVYYEVVALDHHYNPSAPTRIRVPLPDRVPPVAPVVTAAVPSDSTVALAWVPSPSEDVAAHRVERQTGDGPWAEVARLGPTAERWADAAVVAGTVYRYAVVAEDSTGHAGRSEAVQARPYDTGVRPGVGGLRAAVDSSGAVVVSWEAPEAPHWAVVYRADGDGPAGRLAMVEGEAGFRDESAEPGAQVAYAVQVMYRAGGASRPSDPVRVRVPARR